MPTLPDARQKPRSTKSASQAAELLSNAEGREAIWNLVRQNPGMTLEEAVKALKDKHDG